MSPGREFPFSPRQNRRKEIALRLGLGLKASACRMQVRIGGKIKGGKQRYDEELEKLEITGCKNRVSQKITIWVKISRITISPAHDYLTYYRKICKNVSFLFASLFSPTSGLSDLHLANPLLFPTLWPSRVRSLISCNGRKPIFSSLLQEKQREGGRRQIFSKLPPTPCTLFLLFLSSPLVLPCRSRGRMRRPIPVRTNICQAFSAK